MSTPINHHFVSQAHIKNFFNIFENKIYVYDKTKDNHYFKGTTKSLFSEKESNSRYLDGEIDHLSLEKDLSNHFEKDFAKNTDIIKKLIFDKVLTTEAENALIYFAKYGIIGDMRTPRNKKSEDDTFFNAISSIFNIENPEFKNQIDQIFEYKTKVKYSNILNYSEIANEILKLMGNLIIKILVPEKENDFFIIPDFSAGTIRAKINNYFNPDIEEIAYIGLSLTSKIHIHYSSEKLFKNNELPSSGITNCSSDTVYQINKNNLDYSQSTIACENESYLKRFITETQNC